MHAKTSFQFNIFPQIPPSLLDKQKESLLFYFSCLFEVVVLAYSLYFSICYPYHSLFFHLFCNRFLIAFWVRILMILCVKLMHVWINLDISLSSTYFLNLFIWYSTVLWLVSSVWCLTRVINHTSIFIFGTFCRIHLWVK